MMVQMNFSIVADKVLLGTAPMMVSCLEPSLNSITVGMLLMPYSKATPGLSSVLSLYCRCMAENDVKSLLELSCNVSTRCKLRVSKQTALCTSLLASCWVSCEPCQVQVPASLAWTDAYSNGAGLPVLPAHCCLTTRSAHRQSHRWLHWNPAVAQHRGASYLWIGAAHFHVSMKAGHPSTTAAPSLAHSWSRDPLPLNQSTGWQCRVLHLRASAAAPQLALHTQTAVTLCIRLITCALTAAVTPFPSPASS